MATELIPDFPPNYLTRHELRYIRKKRRRCKLIGHLWYATSYNPTTGISLLECRRCWPHKDSIAQGQLYAFPSDQVSV